MVAHIISVSCSDEIANLIKEKQISPSEAFKLGVLRLANQQIPLQPNEKIEFETAMAKKERQRMLLQNTIFDLEDKIKELERGLEPKK